MALRKPCGDQLNGKERVARAYELAVFGYGESLLSLDALLVESKSSAQLPEVEPAMLKGTLSTRFDRYIGNDTFQDTLWRLFGGNLRRTWDQPPDETTRGAWFPVGHLCDAEV